MPRFSLRHMADVIGSPSALLVTVLLLASGVFFHFSENWWTWIDRIIYVATLWFAIVIQASQKRDIEAMHAKLDGLIGAVDKADDRLQGMEKD